MRALWRRRNAFEDYINHELDLSRLPRKIPIRRSPTLDNFGITVYRYNARRQRRRQLAYALGGGLVGWAVGALIRWAILRAWATLRGSTGGRAG